MERLIYSSPLPTKTSLLVRSRFNLPNSAFSPRLRPNLKPAGVFLPKQEDPPPSSSYSSSAAFTGFPVRFSNRESDCADAEVDNSPAVHPFVKFLRGVPESLVQRVLPSGVVVLLSALIAVLIQPFLAPQAYASLQTAAKTGGSTAAIVGGKLLRTELLSSAWTGFFAGCLHTLSGPDHLAALAPLSIGRTRVESAVVGALWGCGHDAGQVLFGLLFLLLKDRLHIEVIRTWGTRVVGLTLLVIGAMGIREASEVPAPCVALESGDCEVSMVEPFDAPKKKIGFATFATGIVHGLQPDALMMVLPALALPSRLAGAAFLCMFLVGTVVAMGSYTVFIGSCSQALKDRIPRITEKLTWASSLVAIALGMAIIISQFFGFSLY
ncbi:hypothetical protein H6P81_018599 [Aristolochia fimbriata]|uniref:Urease accessory protein UreH-like transmembrane domain-containing protein n=1 Tax=Aristolochia fimbriata TaxID=158543 RepID=A0AAV7E1I3_ARIFI|nr:hypothetical protein H6P81_018599 [Aristolochia fimbriata]